MSISKRFVDLPESDVACDGCGYILRGQPISGRCSECGLAIIESAARVADRSTAAADSTGQHSAVRRSDLRWGPWLILAAGAIFGASFVIDPSRGVSPYYFPMQLAARSLAIAGVFVATRLSPGAIEPRAVGLLRRALVVVTVLSLIGMIIVTALGGMRAGVFGWMRDLERSFVPADILIDLLGTTLLILYGGSIAWLRRRFDVAAVALLVALMLLITLVIAGASVFQNNVRFEYGPVLGLGFAVFSIFGEMQRYSFRNFSTNSPLQLVKQFIEFGQAWGTLLLLFQFALMARGESEDAK